MNRVVNLVGKDLRQYRTALLGWSCLIALKLIIGVCLLQGRGTGEQAFGALLILLGGLLVGEYLGPLVLTVLIVQSDAPADPQAFWKCRPVSRLLLLGSKLLTLGLTFVAWPVLLHLPWWIWCGLQMEQMAWAAVDLVVVNGGIVALALGGAVLTRSLLQFVLGSLAAAIVLFILGGFIEASANHETLSRVLLAGVVAGSGVMAVILTSYLVRNPLVARFCAAGMIGLLAANSHWGPRGGQGERLLEQVRASLVLRETSPAPPELKMEVSGADLLKGGWGGRERFELSLRGNRLAGIPFAEVRVNLRLQWSDGTTLAASGDGFQDHLIEKKFGLRDGKMPWTKADGMDSLRVLFELPAEAAARLQRDPAEAELFVRFVQPGYSERTVELGRVESGSRAGEGFRFVNAGSTIRLVRQFPLLGLGTLLGREIPANYWTSFQVVTSGGAFKWTIDRAGSSRPHSSERGWVFGGVLIVISGVERRGVPVKPRVEFTAADLAPGDRLTVSECWPEKRWSLTLRIPAFQLAPPARGE